MKKKKKILSKNLNSIVHLLPFFFRKLNSDAILNVDNNALNECISLDFPHIYIYIYFNNSN